jgi:dUTP pyrophosphatase
MELMELLIKVNRLRAEARLPARGSVNAAGADLACAEAARLEPGERRLVPTGIAVEIPPGFYGRVAPRSGLAVRHGIDVLAGVIDADYRGEILVLLINLGPEPVQFSPGDRIAQLIIEHAAPAQYGWADDLGQTERADGGFGSTGDAQKIS